jgi:DNA (cytosine-5)-methyltransferase 1
MRVVDLFSGCGGLSLGFERAGFEVVAAFDNWEPAVEVYRSNLSHPVFRQDLADTKGSIEVVRRFRPEVIIGGPPCQDFSHAGKRNEGHRANLTIAFAEIVGALRPLWFLMENVDRAQGSLAFRDACRLFRRAGYGLSVVVLDASLCGVPQRRKRLVCVGKLNEEDGFLSPLIEGRLAKKSMTVRDYLGNELEADHYYRHPRNYARRAIYSIDEPSATVRGVNRPIPPGYKRHPGDSVGPKKARPLTTDERARIQTFPKGFRWLGSKSDREQMIGNAVPVKLAEFVARCIADFASGTVCTGVNLRLPLQSPDRSDSDGNRTIQGVAGAIDGIRGTFQ